MIDLGLAMIEVVGEAGGVLGGWEVRSASAAVPVFAIWICAGEGGDV